MAGVTASSCETKREREIIDGDFPSLNLIYALMKGVKTNDKIRALIQTIGMTIETYYYY